VQNEHSKENTEFFLSFSSHHLQHSFQLRLYDWDSFYLLQASQSLPKSP